MVRDVHSLELGAREFCTLVPSLVTDYSYFPKVLQALVTPQDAVNPQIIQAVLLTVFIFKKHSIEEAQSSPSMLRRLDQHPHTYTRMCTHTHTHIGGGALYVTAVPSSKG